MTSMRAARMLTIALTLAGAVAGCAGAAAETTGSAAPGSAVPLPVERANLAATATDFAGWLESFRPRALAAGISPAVFNAAFSDIEPNARVIELDSYQPEFTRPIWEYLDSAVSKARIDTGRGKAAAMAGTLAAIEARYGVDHPYLLAIWGIESAFGANFGSMPVIQSLATLAFQGRRAEFGEEQLLAALRILQAGDIAPARMVGSWAGAMGHTQFIPTSYLAYAVDFTGDGRRDIWAADAADALASTANYLATFGWQKGAPAVVEVRLPAGFDYTQVDERVRRTTAEWEVAGVVPMIGAWKPSTDVSILLPAGARGPAFATYPNFRVIKRYNNATSYALAVAHLADRIAGAGPFVADWPRADRELSLTEKQELQARLTALGFDTGGVDGIIGPLSRAAVRRFQQANALVPDGYVSAALLDAVRAAGG